MKNMSKSLLLLDYSNIKDTTSGRIERSIQRETATHKDTDIIVKINGTDKVLFRGKNKIILPGAAFTARAHFDLPRNEITPSYNTVLNLEHTVLEQPSSKERCYLFCVGTDGCGRENSQVKEVNYAKWITTDALVPFRFPLITEDITTAQKQIYHGRKVIGERAAYYFKTFESEPKLIQRLEDGTIIDSNIYSYNNELEVETLVEVKIKVTEEECREWFINTVGINEARVNTISLCTAWLKDIDGIGYYQDIRPLTKLNMPNEQLIELSKGLDITYQIYY